MRATAKVQRCSARNVEGAVARAGCEVSIEPVVNRESSGLHVQQTIVVECDWVRCATRTRTKLYGSCSGAAFQRSA